MNWPFNNLLDSLHVAYYIKATAYQFETMTRVNQTIVRISRALCLKILILNTVMVERCLCDNGAANLFTVFT